VLAEVPGEAQDLHRVAELLGERNGARGRRIEAAVVDEDQLCAAFDSVHHGSAALEDGYKRVLIPVERDNDAESRRRRSVGHESNLTTVGLARIT
jgi:hypothetical protein